MNDFSENILRIGKRYNNPKRAYVLVNPLQAKHMPARPTQSVEMMKALGAVIREKYPTARLVIGFAETATAIGAQIARCLADTCVYIQTTRESFPDVEEWIDFLEEHSHAVEQKLCADHFAEWLCHTDTVVFVDDEITTGKTLCNMVKKLEERYPQLKEKQLVAASIFNRVSEEDETKMQDAGIKCEYLVKPPQDDYTKMVNAIKVHEADAVAPMEVSFRHCDLCCEELQDPRCGVSIAAYQHNCETVADTFIKEILAPLDSSSRVLVLGTEECMYPALVLGGKLESELKISDVRCHATTRSPIGISNHENYPIQNGIKLASFYDQGRTTYLYNLDQYDIVIVISDSPQKDFDAMRQLAAVMCPFENTKFFYIQGGNHVWYL